MRAPFLRGEREVNPACYTTLQEGLYEEMTRRAKERQARRAKASSKRMGVALPTPPGAKPRRRGSTSSGENTSDAPVARKPAVMLSTPRHEHVFLPDEEYDGDTDLWTKRCACGFSVEYERM